MSEGTSDDRACQRCGYLLSPFDTDCPKCARLAATRRAASGPAEDRPDSREPHSPGRTGLDAGGIALSVVAGCCFFMGTAVVARYAYHAHASELWPLAGPLACVLLGCALGTPHAWERMWERLLPPREDEGILATLFDMYFFGQVVLGVLAIAGLMLLGDLVYGGDGPFLAMLALTLMAGPFYIVASALFFHLLHTRWRRRVYATDEPTGLYDGPRYTKSDLARYLLVIGLGLVGALLVVANLHLRATFVIVALFALFWLGIIVLVLMTILGRFFGE